MGAPPPYGSPGGQSYASIDPWFWQSIAVTVLCCLPLGIAGIVQSNKAKVALAQGNYLEAQQRAKSAKTFSLVGLVIGLLVVPFQVWSLMAEL